MSPTPVDVELTQDEIVQRIEEQAQQRRHISAQEMVDAFKAGRLDNPGAVIDLLSLAGMLDTDHPLYVEP